MVCKVILGLFTSTQIYTSSPAAACTALRMPS